VKDKRRGYVGSDRKEIRVVWGGGVDWGDRVVRGRGGRSRER